ncbi:MAG TPA: RNA polymerase sigma factor RpoD/SigA [Oculatellaceae cyanobacterium]
MTKSLTVREVEDQETFALRSEDEPNIPEAEYQKAGDDVIDTYLRQVRRNSLLSKEEELAFARAARNGDHKAAMKLAQGNLRLVIKTAKQYRDRGLSFEDLIQEGNLGLLKAVQRFDPERGFRFSTYAVWWIRQSIVKAISDKAKLVKIPPQMEKEIWRANKATEELRKELGREPSFVELSQRLSLPVHRLRLMHSIGQEHISLDIPVWSDQDETLIEVLTADTPSDEAASQSLLTEYLEELISCLNCRERDVVRLRYGLEGTEKALPVEETAKRMGLSIERVKRIEARALLKLRRYAHQKQLHEYLAS